jgi:spermidine synthase
MTALRSGVTRRCDAEAGGRIRAVLFALFFASGFCGLLYQVVWLRMAFAQFGVITPVLSVVISVFMLGLGVGSVFGERWGRRLSARYGLSPAITYSIAELLIGAGALAVPGLLQTGAVALLPSGTIGSASYLALSGLAIAVAILPWCVLMGTTFPLMMGFVRLCWPRDTRSFSFLYVANVLGATAGTLISACVLIELFGLRTTSIIAAATNVAIAVVSVALARFARAAAGDGAVAPTVRETKPAPAARGGARSVILFTTGFCSLGMEVVWTRGFTAVLQTTIYAFAQILATYLLATALGAAVYRRSLRRDAVPGNAWLLIAAAAAAVLPAILDDPRVQHASAGVLGSIVPICAVLGFLTPKLVDEASAGDPTRAGRSYAVNILGSILGPLLAGYALVPLFDIRTCLLLLAAPLAALAGWAAFAHAGRKAGVVVAWAATLALFVVGLAVSESYEAYAGHGGPKEVHRDAAATAIAYGEGLGRGLLVNGVGITALTPITKNIAHLPLAVHGHAKDGLVICFGMGTTLRSMASWGIDTTAVDLTGAVIDSFGFFHADAAKVAAEPNVHFVVDDGRRFLARTDRRFDVIVIDPPPPVEAAGSSLLYSREMYDLVKRHLRPDGILQQWLPDAEPAVQQAALRSLGQAFPYVRAFRGFGDFGWHFLASMQPIPPITASEFAARLPPAARADIVEFTPAMTAEDMAHAILAASAPLSAFISSPQDGPAITDDRPFNEYYLLRRNF